MCGFSGFLYHQKLPVNVGDILSEMAGAIKSRGPDSSGIWFSDEELIGLSHRRLAVVDLSPAGHQPMHSRSGRFTIAFNGEIYNHEDIRSEIENVVSDFPGWNGFSDTETLLAGFEYWGVEDTLNKAIGMFAISLWDSSEKTLYLARDRFGEKPLYYSQQKDYFVFGSEIKCFRAHPHFEPEISRDSISLLLRHNYIPAPYSIYEGVYKLMPGSYLTIKGKDVELRKYWTPYDSFSRKNLTPEQDDMRSLEEILKKSIRRQMVADVPLGAFLSGGVDSSLIVSLMQSMSDKPIKTFSIGFEEEEFNEAKYAKKVAEYLGTDHTELYVTADDALSVVDKLASIYDEPFSDSSQIPTYLVSKMASKHVTVALSGDAGDEIFCGYNRYLMTNKVWSKIRFMPYFLREYISKFLFMISIDRWNRVNQFLPKKLRMSNLGDKLHKAASVILCDSIDNLYKGLVSHCQKPESLVINSKEPLTALTDPERNPNLSHPIEQMMALDTVSYLPDDILVKVDRAAMANSLETRIPFLDHTVFEFAWKMSFDSKLNNGVTKSCLRDILYRYVPKDLIERPKTGFGIPLAEWLRGPLKQWAESLLEEEKLREQGFFDSALVSKMWAEHQSKLRNWQYQLWDVLMFQAWFEKHHQ